MAIWKDKSKSYGDSTVVSSETKAGGFKLQIHRSVIHEPDDWLASCKIFSQLKLKSKDIEEAKKEAESKLLAILENAVQELKEQKA